MDFSGDMIDRINKEFCRKNWSFHSFHSSQFYSTSNVFALAWVYMRNYILKLFNILLSESWLTKNSRTIRIPNKWDQSSFMNLRFCVLEVSGTWKFYVKDSKSCIVNFWYWFFTGFLKDLQAIFLPISYTLMNLLVRAGKILFNRREESN